MAFTTFYTADAATGLLKRDVGLAALTADAYVGTQHNQGAATATHGICIINVESIDVASSNEVYRFVVLGSNVADRSDGEILGMIEIGDAGTIALETVDAAAGDRNEIRFRTEKNGTKFQYIDLHLDVTGTTPSIGFSAFMSVE